MKDKSYLLAMLGYNTWANGELYKVVKEMPADEVKKERPTPLKSIFVSLNHLLVVQKIWHAHMTGAKHGFDNLRTELHDNLDALYKAQQEMDGVIADYAAGLDDTALEEEVDYELISGNKGKLSRASILTHLITHGSYHRGWIVDMLGQAGVQQPQMDIPVYERAAREHNLPALP